MLLYFTHRNTKKSVIFLKVYNVFKCQQDILNIVHLDHDISGISHRGIQQTIKDIPTDNSLLKVSPEMNMFSWSNI